MNSIKILFFLTLLLSNNVKSDSFTEFFLKNNHKILNEEKELVTPVSIENKWYIISDIYFDLQRFRMGEEIDTDIFNENVERTIDDIENDFITGLNTYEKDILVSILNSMILYVNSSETSIGDFSRFRSNFRLSKNIEEKYGTVDSGFTYMLSSLVSVLFFQDSFWIKNILGYKGDVKNSLKMLDYISDHGDLFKDESSLFLSKFYSNILLDHISSLRYTSKLILSYPKSKYIRYLYAVDLYHTGKIKGSYEYFSQVNSELSDQYYPFEYSSLIYEIKCLLLLDKGYLAEEVINYAKQIHEGYLLEELKKWKLSLDRRKEIVYRFEELNFRDIQDITKNDNDKKVTLNILFDHGYYEEVLGSYSEDKSNELMILYLRTAVILKRYDIAERIFEMLKNDYENILEEHPDKGRLKLLRNYVVNVLQ
ncbi:MAG: hypothetical protein JXR69_08180 [Candidatus Delongbacteria bacterium]|nr:hypothetical protein [Candidatus Delongbacteria bacterium]